MSCSKCVGFSLETRVTLSVSFSAVTAEHKKQFDDLLQFQKLLNAEAELSHEARTTAEQKTPKLCKNKINYCVTPCACDREVLLLGVFLLLVLARSSRVDVEQFLRRGVCSSPVVVCHVMAGTAAPKAGT